MRIHAHFQPSLLAGRGTVAVTRQPGVARTLRACTVVVALALALAAAPPASPAHAASHVPVSQVADINPGGSSSHSLPDWLTVFGGHLYFSAFDGNNGTELWRTDGTDTELFENIRGVFPGSQPSQLTVFGDHLYFAARDEDHGRELWRTDGTTTELFADINPEDPDKPFSQSSHPEELTEFGGDLYFRAFHDDHGFELWRTDGTDTEQVADINDGGSSSPRDLTAFDGHLYFSAHDGASAQLWRTDGTTTERFKRIRLNGSAFSVSLSAEFTILGGHLYFGADDGVNGRELWRTDGTEAGTVLFANLNDDEGSSPTDLTLFGGRLYFSADDGANGRELWRTDGDTTELVADINPGASSSPEGFTEFGGHLYFSADDGANGRELWRTDGDTTELVADINPGASSSPEGFTEFGGHLYFSAEDDDHGRELWRTDGDTTELVNDIWAGTGSSTPPERDRLIVFGNHLYFVANDGNTGWELWRTDGVAVLDDQPPLVTDVLVDPNPVSVGESVSLTATIDDTATGGSTIADAEYTLDGETWFQTTGSFDDVTVEVSATIGPFTKPDVVEVCVRGSDSAGNVSDPECVLLAVFDPTGGFVTGGGWINSQAGALHTDPTAAGRAHFGFVARYQPGATLPSGNTEFHFRAGDFRFTSTSYEWLVVSSHTARYKGSGTVNGVGDYGFMLTATDSSINGGGTDDTFRLHVWDKTNGETVYDNGSQQPIGAGSVRIHTKR